MTMTLTEKVPVMEPAFTPTPPPIAETMPTKAPETKPQRFNPFETFETLQEEMNRLFNFNWPFAPLSTRFTLPTLPKTATVWTPRLDVFELNGDLVVKVELPGVKKEDIEVSLTNGDLLVRGERHSEEEVKDEHYYRMERSYGTFFRRLPIPFEAKAETTTAKFVEGVLEVHLPKPTVTPPTKQPITVT